MNTYELNTYTGVTPVQAKQISVQGDFVIFWDDGDEIVAVAHQPDVVIWRKDITL